MTDPAPTELSEPSEPAEVLQLAEDLESPAMDPLKDPEDETLELPAEELAMHVTERSG